MSAIRRIAGRIRHEERRGVMLGHDVYLALRNIKSRIHRHRAAAVPYLYVYPVPSLFPVAVAQLGDTHDIGRRAGM